MGDNAGDTLLGRVRALTLELNPASYDPRMKVGLAGDVSNAVAEKASIANEALLAFIAAAMPLRMSWAASPWDTPAVTTRIFPVKPRRLDKRRLWFHRCKARRR